MKLRTIIFTCLTLAITSVSSSSAMRGKVHRPYRNTMVLVDPFDRSAGHRMINQESESLMTAVRSGDTARVQAILESPATTVNVNVEDEQGWTPLLLAAAGRPIEILNMLLTRGAYLQACTKCNGFTALHRATKEGTCEAMKALLLAGAKVNATDNSGETPLHKAVVRGELEKVEILLEAGADVNASNERERHPFMLPSIYQ